MKKNAFLPLLLLGLGLILAGLAVFFWLRPAAETAAETASVIPVPVSYPAPELQLHSLDGEPVNLADYRGQVVLVNMWATWCPPCKQEMPDLQAYYQAHQEQGFVIIGINDGETADVVRPFVAEYGLTFPVWLDERGLSEKAFRTINLPSSYVIDRQGTVRFAWKGAISYDVLESYITPLLDE